MFEEVNLYKNLQEIIKQLKSMLKSDTEIDEQIYCEEVGNYSKELKILLKKYFEVDEETRDKMRPFLNYYKHLQHYLVFLVMNSEILKVPHHEEILQILIFIENQERLIKETYVRISEAQKQLFSEKNLKKLDAALELRLKGLKKFRRLKDK
ncbi:MAG: hypothetical protein ACFFD2_02465 [Promethearchaeota archaeon]